MPKKQPKAFAILGPTASGKTELACKIADNFPVDIISVDSSMIYKELNIGTAKPDRNLLVKYPHKLIDIRNVTDIYSVGDFILDAVREIKASFANGRVPLLVGGTMMYFHALQNGIAVLPEADKKIRETILAKAENIGWSALHDELSSFDKVSYCKLEPMDKQRVQRAHEVFMLTGKPLSSFVAKKPGYSFDIDFLAIMPRIREHLHERIANRFNDMLKKGLVEEVQHLYAMPGVSLDLPAIRSVGYRQVWQYLSGDYDYTTMCERSVAATRQLAKRQLTWIRNWDELTVFTELSTVEDYIKTHINLG